VSIGRRVQDSRQKLGLTQEQLAKELDVTHQHISRLEAGQASPSLELVVKLAQRLGLTTDALLTGTDVVDLDLVGSIRADPDLSREAKRHLIGLIDELRR
jgi:transcriptional regulator with XRE-family HTH domain